MQTQCQLENLEIIYEDDELVAIHKPAGLLVHRSSIDKHETHFAVQMTRDLTGRPVFPIHRLDKPTSGLLLFSFNSESARHLCEQFMAHSIQKEYLALCRGWADESGFIDHALKYHKDKIADKDKRADELIQSAQTEYRTLATTSVDHTIGKFTQQRYSLVHLQPKTGRKHQLRRHLNHISHPIIGDVKYGDRHHNHFFHNWLGQHRLYLAATALSFIHPRTNQAMTIRCPLEDTYKTALKALNLHLPE